MNYLPYGSKTIKLELSSNAYRLIKPRNIKPSIDQSLIITNALNSPENRPINKQFWREKSIAIAINDQTRPIPNKILLPCLINYLLNNGARQENISFFIASGTHKPLTPEEYPVILDSSIISRFRIFSHDCDDEGNLEFLGITSAKTPVYINHKFMNSEIKILVGNIEPHHFMGFSGGVKTAAIGLTGRKTITTNHSMLMRPNTVMGLFSSNPMRMDVEEIGKMIRIDFALNVILNDDKEVITAFWSEPQKVMADGIAFIRKNIQLNLGNLMGAFDLVIASPGGYPKDINFYQAQKAITNACLFAKTNGAIILAAECRDGLGSELFEQFLTSRTSFQDVIRDFEAMQFQIGPHKAYQLAKQAINHRIILISEINKKMVFNMHLIPSKSLNHALEFVRDYLPKKPKIAVLPYATHTMPTISEINN